MTLHDVAIIGGGPTGLACAIEAQKANLTYLLIEKGGITDAIRRFPVNMTFFSTPELLELGNLPFPSVNVRPNRREVLEYYRRVVQHFDLQLCLHTTVAGINRRDNHFELHTTDGQTIRSRNVIIATGYFDHTNRLNVPGEELPHVRHYYDEPYAYARSHVLVVGGRNSAVETALELYRHDATVTLVHRDEELGSIKYWIRPDIDNRIREGSIRCCLDSIVREIRPGETIIENRHSQQQTVVRADFVFAMIGYRPDAALLRSCGVKVHEPTLIPEYDPKSFVSNVPGIYLAGSVACGCETWNIFIENGRGHAQPIIADIRSRR